MALISRIIRKAQQLGTAEGGSAARNDAAVQSGAGASSVEIKPGGPRSYFFVSGHPRSGTNWISNLCNLHPDICCHGEFHFQVMYEAFERFTGKPWYVASESHVKPVAEQSLTQLVHKTLLAMAERRKPGASVIGDHTPKPFQLMLPDAGYLIALRDGRDVVVSWTFHLLRTGRPDIVHDQVRGVFERELGACAGEPEKLKDAAASLLRDAEWVGRLASGWSLQVQNDLPKIQSIEASGGPSRVMLVRYEDLLADIESGRSRMYEFLGVNADRAMPLSRETHTIPGFGRDDPTSFYRKGEWGDWKNYFDERSAGWFKAAAARQLIDAGYEKDDCW